MTPPRRSVKPPRRVRVPTGGPTLVGDGYGTPAASPVVLLHGGGQTRHAWGGTAAALATRGWYAVALDLRGHGESDRAPDGDYRLETFAADVAAVAASFATPPVLVGASLGGLASLLAVGEAPAPLARALVLVDITPKVQNAGVERILAFMRGNPDGFATLEEAADAVADFVPHRPRPRDLAGLRKNLRRGRDGRYRWHWDPRMLNGDRTIDTRRSSDRLDRLARTLTIPTLLVRGRMSDVVGEEDARAFLAAVPHARFADVSGAAHMVAGDRNDPFTEAVVGFLADLGSPA